MDIKTFGVLMSVVLLPSIIMTLTCTPDDILEYSSQTEPLSARQSASAAYQPVKVAAPFDLNQRMQQVRIACRPDGNGFQAEDKTIAVRTTPQGAFTVSPRGSLDAAPRPTVGAPTPFNTVGLGRLGFDLSNLLSSMKNTADGGWTIVREPSGSVIEHLLNRDAAVEQSWSFKTTPAGTDDLLVRIQATGQEFAGETENGLHFVDRATGLGLSYGVVTWIDANQQTTELRPTWENGEILLRVPAELVELSAYPAVLDQAIGAEFGMDNPVYLAAYAWTDNPAIAFNGTNYPVAWSPSSLDKISLPGTFARRISTAGVVLDNEDIMVAGDSPLPKSGLAATSNGSDYFFVWEDYRVELPYVYAARVSSTGFQIGTGSNVELGYPAIVFDGTNYLVTWLQFPYYANTNDLVRGTRVSTSATILDTGGFDISGITDTIFFPAVVFDGRDLAEKCDGPTATCPADDIQPDGTTCDDGIFCNEDDTCSSGTYDEHAGTPCPDDGLWRNGTESCDEENQECTTKDVPDCSDNGLFCDGTEFCDGESDECASSGDPCDIGETCDETEDDVCPTPMMTTTTTPYRPMMMKKSDSAVDHVGSKDEYGWYKKNSGRRVRMAEKTIS